MKQLEFELRPVWFQSKSPFPHKGDNTVISIIVVVVMVVVIIIIITFAPYKFREIKGRQRKGRWQENTPRAGPGSKASLPRSDAEHPQRHWALLLLSPACLPACLPRLLGAFASFSPTSTQLHFRAVRFLRNRQQWKDLGQIYWWFLPSALMFSRLIYSKLKRRWNSRLTDVRVLSGETLVLLQKSWPGQAFGKLGGRGFGGQMCC